jgi:hypothetical protein
MTAREQAKYAALIAAILALHCAGGVWFWAKEIVL